MNAGLHFLKFVKCMRNSAVMDPAFNATMENTRDIITSFQVM